VVVHPVQVEVILLGLADGTRTDGEPDPTVPARPGDLMYAIRCRELGAGQAPDLLARSLCPNEVEVVHSTSWRHRADGVLVLTYAAVPRGDVLLPHPLVAPSVVCSGDALAPAPKDVHLHHVAAHAVRHLSYLRAHDPAVAEAARASSRPAVWAACDDAATGMPTAPHSEAHQAADRRAGSRARH
jgi:hypothetical protein